MGWSAWRVVKRDLCFILRRRRQISRVNTRLENAYKCGARLLTCILRPRVLCLGSGSLIPGVSSAVHHEFSTEINQVPHLSSPCGCVGSPQPATPVVLNGVMISNTDEVSSPPGEARARGVPICVEGLSTRNHTNKDRGVMLSSSQRGNELPRLFPVEFRTDGPGVVAGRRLIFCGAMLTYRAEDSRHVCAHRHEEPGVAMTSLSPAGTPSLSVLLPPAFVLGWRRSPRPPAATPFADAAARKLPPDIISRSQEGLSEASSLVGTRQARPCAAQRHRLQPILPRATAERHREPSLAMTNDADNGSTGVIACAIACQAISGFFVAARFYSRAVMTRAVSWEDYCILAAWVCALRCIPAPLEPAQD